MTKQFLILNQRKNNPWVLSIFTYLYPHGLSVMESEHNSSLKDSFLWAFILFIIFSPLVPNTVPGTLILSNNVYLIIDQEERTLFWILDEVKGSNIWRLQRSLSKGPPEICNKILCNFYVRIGNYRRNERRFFSVRWFHPC